MNTSLWKILYGFWDCLSPVRRKQLTGLILLTFVGAAAEMVSIGALVPFLAILADPSLAMQSPLVEKLFKIHSFDETQARSYFTLFFTLAVILSCLLRIALIRATAKVNYNIGHDIGHEIYRRTLYQSYEIHLARNSSAIIGGIKKIDTTVAIFLNLLQVPSAMIMAFCIIIALTLIDYTIALAIIFGLGSIYAILFTLARKRLSKNSRDIAHAVTQRIQIAEEGLGGIRDILLDHTQPIFLNRFAHIDRIMRDAETSNQTIAPSPRFIVEGIGMIMIASLAYWLTQSRQGFAEVIPVLGAFALGAQRLMPMVQHIYHGWVTGSGNKQTLADVLALLHQTVDETTLHKYPPLTFGSSIHFDNVCFTFQAHTPRILENITLTIPKGAKVGFIGSTGSGKSTVMDLLMGLITPTTGHILIDGQPLDTTRRLAWQNNIAHVPQAIYLADSSFAENIAFGTPAEYIDMEKVKWAADLAQLSTFIEVSPQGYATVVGERGVRLSGGQRQRVGIARALYKQANVLVLDEATSALDNETEHAVMQAICTLGSDVTILMIAHRLSTLDNCDFVVEISQGNIISTLHRHHTLHQRTIQQGSHK